MRPGTKIVRLVMVAFFITAIAYFGAYTYHVLFRGVESTRLYSYSAEDTIEAVGYMVREEQTLQGSDQLQEIVPAEGETVAAGDALSVIYEDQAALDRHLEVVKLENRLESLQYILSHSTDAVDSANLNSSITHSLVELHQLTAQEDLFELGEQSSELKTLLFRRDYIYNGSTNLNQESQKLKKRIKKLRRKNRNSITTVEAPASGAFSSMVDGYEGVLTPDSIVDLTPERFHALLEQKAPVTEGTSLGKLVTSPEWHFATLLDEERAQRLKLGDQVDVRFKSMTRTVPMTVTSLSQMNKEGEICAVLSSNKYLALTTLLREQTADIIFGSVDGFRVSKSAVHVKNETGEIGVYRIYGTQAKWVPVEILWEEEDYYLIRQKPQVDEEGEETEASQLDTARQLRDGVEIIVKGRDLYDGKVLSKTA
jgi:hypothetical protein